VKILLVTEKCSRSTTERDGGARLVETIQQAFGDSLSIMQFGPEANPSAKWHFDYPSNKSDRFERRLDNANFIAMQVKAVESYFTHVIFVHVSMQFGIADLPLRHDLQVWTFPMFLTPSYRASGEIVPQEYFEAEKRVLSDSKNILTPSHLEKRQLVEIYSIPKERIHVVPRGIQTQLLDPKIRALHGPPAFCSVGSIKPQKNTLGLIHLFAKAQALLPGATLQIIGPVQNREYFSKIQVELQRLNLLESVKFSGYIPPHQLPQAIEKAHLHLSASMCETFGRSIFETLASGLPNVARKTGNAAAEFLAHLPYARFVDDDNKALEAIEEMLAHLSQLSSMALEIGDLYDDQILSRLLTSKLCSKDLIAISDFDGTLYHKDDPEKTFRCINAFQQFPKRIVCSARQIHDLLDKLKQYDLKVDWIVGCSGSIVADGRGKLLWVKPLDLDTVTHLEGQMPGSKRIEFEGHVLQMAVPAESMLSPLRLRTEIYQETAFIAHWEASKLRAVHRLLRHIGWQGQVRAFGDGPYDHELLTYFDGTWITPTPIHQFQKKEIEYV
jgi:glycosyltransferase involved in cell wall biosynthesis